MKIQDYSSNYCGFFCIAFLTCMFLNHKLNNFYNIFSESNLKINDDIVLEYLLEIIKTMY